jgi:hypothetical protein
MYRKLAEKEEQQDYLVWGFFAVISGIFRRLPVMDST